MQIDGKIMGSAFSAGISSFPAQRKTGEELLLSANRALYAAKQAGRNQEVGWQK